MAKVTETYTLELSETEARALKRLIGNMNDKQFSNVGIMGVKREAIHDIWAALTDKLMVY